MGAVFEAQHVQLRRRAAAKFLCLDVSRYPSLYQRFVNETPSAQCSCKSLIDVYLSMSMARPFHGVISGRTRPRHVLWQPRIRAQMSKQTLASRSRPTTPGGAWQPPSPLYGASVSGLLLGGPPRRAAQVAAVSVELPTGPAWWVCRTTYRQNYQRFSTDDFRQTVLIRRFSATAFKRCF